MEDEIVLDILGSLFVLSRSVLWNRLLINITEIVIHDSSLRMAHYSFAVSATAVVIYRQMRCVLVMKHFVPSLVVDRGLVGGWLPTVMRYTLKMDAIRSSETLETTTPGFLLFQTSCSTPWITRQAVLSLSESDCELTDDALARHAFFERSL
jgi:hypothetical protein